MDTALARTRRSVLPLLLLVVLCLSSCCLVLTVAQSYGDLRLVRMDSDLYRSEFYPGDASQPATYSRGLLQIFNSSAPGHGWGTVCNDQFDMDDLAARVVCVQLGWPARAAALGRLWHANSSRWVTTTNPGSASLKILLDEVSCDGTENRLLDCGHSPFGQSDCQHIEDVAVDCFVSRLASLDSTGGAGGGGGGGTGSGGGGWSSSSSGGGGNPPDGGLCPGCTGGGGPPPSPASSDSSFEFQWPIFFVASVAGALLLATILICRARRRGTPDGKGGNGGVNKIHHRNRSAASSQVADRAAEDDGTKTVMTFMIDPCLLASQKMRIAVISPSAIAAARAASVASAPAADVDAEGGVAIGVGTLSLPGSAPSPPPHGDVDPDALPVPSAPDADVDGGVTPRWVVDVDSSAAQPPGMQSLALPRLSFLNNITPSATPRFQGVGHA